jgi:hypothetical protein
MSKQTLDSEEISLTRYADTEFNGAEVPVLFCPETQSWCVIKQNAQRFVRAFAEKRDQRRKNWKKLEKKMFSKSLHSYLKTEWG